ncbi:superoxide dismutase family protein [Streptomyces rimosus]|uniref:superoxide dismutase family protein n=1 Tax=Streptomyces rimosus TaxID=1927 RepID=UPI000B1293B0|nr:superoxide dismutase family protein [Streptomyces rimosus]
MQTLRESSTRGSSTTPGSAADPAADEGRAGGGAARVRTTARAAGACAAGLATAGALLLAPAAMAADDDKVQKNTVDPQYSVAIAAQFARPNAQMLSSALTYDPKLVPVGSHVTVSERSDSKQTRVGLRVTDLPANRTYGAHVHTGACGVRPTDAGVHYQHRKDPRTPSVDPAYANPKNEVWLDFTTNANGEGSAESLHAWSFRPGEARSVAIHERRTATKPGVAGTAGRVVACYTVPFNNSKEAGKAVAGVLSKIF